MSAVSSATTASVTQDQFLQLLVAELQNQDPTNPVDSSQTLTQLATFSQLSGIQSLNATFSQSLQLQQLTQGSSLIGKTVDYVPTGATATSTGVVSALTVNNGSYQLTIGNDQVGLNQISTVH